MTDCKYMEGKSCNFEQETTREDCILCMPNVMIFHMNILLDAVCTMDVRFGNARNIYAAFQEINETQRGLVKLMKKEYPEAFERARIPKSEPKGLV